MNFKRYVYTTIALIIIIIGPLQLVDYMSSSKDYTIKIKKYYPQIDSSLIDSKIVLDTTYYVVPDFSLLNHTGDTIHLSDDSNYKVIDFFFTRCPTICPVMSKAMYQVQDEFKDVGDVSLFSVSIDPDHDNEEVLAKYSRKYDALDSMWYFLTGEKEIIYNIASEGFKLSAVQEGTGAGGFTHSDRLVLIDREGTIRGYYHGTDEIDVERLVVELRMLIKEERINKRSGETS
jgi:protein SCO1/2